MSAMNPPITDWTNKTVWVVGASDGIGKALAERLTELGAKVIATARRAEALSALSPAVWRIVPADIGQPESLERAINDINAAGRDLDVVFWVAGVYHPMATAALDLAAVEETFNINVLSGYRGLKSILDLWLQKPKPGHRHWVWVSSVAGYRGLPQAAAYGASKAALTYLAETNYLELKPHGIGVSVVCPGFVESRLTKKNDFHMPAMITAQEAAEFTLKGMGRGEFEIHYPKRFSRVMKLLEILPYRLYFALARKSLPK
jgi:NAD(P)-dependent dehydrogenase (short-subunit alcohol dehydrogenase family)